jgi:spermidine/putrescine transport system ATP-binding protein
VMIDDFQVTFDGQEFECVDNGFDDNEEVDIVIRPEDLDIVPLEMGKLNGIVRSSLFKGVHYEIVVETEFREFIIHTTDNVEVDKKVGLHFFPEDVHIMSKMGSY